MLGILIEAPALCNADVVLAHNLLVGVAGGIGRTRHVWWHQHQQHKNEHHRNERNDDNQENLHESSTGS